MRKLISFLLLSFVAYTLQAQIKDPVKFKTELNSLSDTEAEIVFTAAIDKGWHVYSTDLGDGGPISATFNVEKKSGVELVGKLKPVGKEIATFDKLFEMKVRYFENTAKFVQKVKLTGGAYAIEGYLEYGACDDESCLPPTEVPFKFSGEAKAGTTAAPVAKADKPETKEAEETSDSSLPTLEEFMNSDMMKTTIEAAIGQTESEDFTVDLYAEGNQLHFDYTVTSLPETTEEERALYADVLKGTMESAGTTFNAVASQVKDSVSNEVVEVVISYLDGAGNVIYSVTYSSADAVA